MNIEQARKEGHQNLRLLDDHLVENKIVGKDWLVLNRPTIADIACFPYVALAEEGGISLNDYPAARSWINRFKKLPQFIVMPGIPPLHGMKNNEGEFFNQEGLCFS